jgi:hypothetical protein
VTYRSFRAFVVSCFRDYAQTHHENTKVRKHERAIQGNWDGHQFEELSGRILGAAVAIGPGFLEPIYRRAMEVALEHRQIRFQRRTVLSVLSSFRSFVITPKRITKTRKCESTKKRDRGIAMGHQFEELSGWHSGPALCPNGSRKHESAKARKSKIGESRWGINSRNCRRECTRGFCLTSMPPLWLSNGLYSETALYRSFRAFVVSCFRDHARLSEDIP